MVPWTNILVARKGYQDEKVFKYANVFLKELTEVDYVLFLRIVKSK